MPYSVNENMELRTPGGCRIDNGACFTAIGLDLICRVIQLQFTDGSLKHLDAGAMGWVYYDFVNRYDPGCVWNALLRQSIEDTGAPPPSPARPFMFADLTASGPDFVPVNYTRPNVEDYFMPCPGES